MKISNSQLRILEKPEYFDIVLSVLNGYDYSSKIARELGKKQPTVTEQLNRLENLGIVRIVKKSKSKKFEVVEGVLCEYVYSMIEEFRDYREKEDVEGYFQARKLKKLDRDAIEKAIPCKLISAFFFHYSVMYLDILGGKIRTIDDIVISFFGALDSQILENSQTINKLKSGFGIEEKGFKIIVDIMSF